MRRGKKSNQMGSSSEVSCRRDSMDSKEQAMQEKARWLVRDYGRLFMTATDTETQKENLY